MELSPERELARQQWRERIMDFIAIRAVSPMVRSNINFAEPYYTDEQIS